MNRFATRFQFLLRVFGPLLGLTIGSTIACYFYVPNQTGGRVWFTLMVLQLGTWYLVDLLTTGRHPRDRFIGFAPTGHKDDALVSIGFWYFLSGVCMFAALIAVDVSGDPYSPADKPLAGGLFLGILHFVAISIMVAARDTYSSFAEHILPGIERDYADRKQRPTPEPKKPKPRFDRILAQMRFEHRKRLHAIRRMPLTQEAREELLEAEENRFTYAITELGDHDELRYGRF